MHSDFFLVSSDAAGSAGGQYGQRAYQLTIRCGRILPGAFDVNHVFPDRFPERAGNKRPTTPTPAPRAPRPHHGATLRAWHAGGGPPFAHAGNALAGTGRTGWPRSVSSALADRGTEVCLYLKTYPEVRPVAVVRTSISGSLAGRLGIEVRVGAFGTESESRELLRDCDLVVDFSAPAGEVNDIRAHYERYVRQAVACAPEGARYVFISTINAFGMNPRFNRAKHYFLPHSIYAHTKRFAERLACRLGRQHRRAVYIFRLGHVHGALQRVSQRRLNWFGELPPL